mmetsp:Transcript_63063/g.131082  ORF Transcript_63063/g.131082 Transcript_63063/m.131082 type:complete len:223 (-) Transcript_63063:398-1066(-)
MRNAAIGELPPKAVRGEVLVGVVLLQYLSHRDDRLLVLVVVLWVHVVKGGGGGRVLVGECEVDGHNDLHLEPPLHELDEGGLLVDLARRDDDFAAHSRGVLALGLEAREREGGSHHGLQRRCALAQVGRLTHGVPVPQFDLDVVRQAAEAELNHVDLVLPPVRVLAVLDHLGLVDEVELAVLALTLELEIVVSLAHPVSRYHVPSFDREDDSVVLSGLDLLS